jgi:hypothetical protein
MLSALPTSSLNAPSGLASKPSRHVKPPVMHYARASMERLALPVRFGGLSAAQKEAILKSAPVTFVAGSDYRALGETPRQAAEQVRMTALKALKEAQLACHPKVKGPLAEGFGGAALVQAGSGGNILLADSNINYRADIKICAEQNLLDRIIKHPAVLAADKPEIKLISNILCDFDAERYRNRHLTPCNGCLDAFQAVMLSRSGLLSGNTLVASIVSQEQNGQPQTLIEVRPLKDLLPMADKLHHSFPESGIGALPVNLSASATALLQARQAQPVTDAQIRETMQRALAGFAESALHKRSARGGEYLGTGILIYPDLPGAEPVFETGSSLHVKNSEPLYPELDALSNARNIKPGTSASEHLQSALQTPWLVEELTRPQPGSHLQDKRTMPPLAEGLAMVGFVHRQADQPRPKLLGLLKDAAGGRDFLVGVIDQDVIKVYAASEFLPIQYKDHREPAPGLTVGKSPRQKHPLRVFLAETWVRLKNWLRNILGRRSG